MNVPYNARFPNHFKKQVRKLPNNVKPEVTKKIKLILEDPYCGIALVGNLKGMWKIRIGKYRIEYQISNSDNLVIFYSIDLRKRIYK